MSTFWLIAGGPSLRGVDLSFLYGRQIIAINRSHELVRPYVALDRDNVRAFWLDYRFWSLHQESLQLSAAKGMELHAATDRVGRHSSYPATIKTWTLLGTKGLETRPGLLRHGNNTGYAAINLAYHLGAWRIILLGYDFCPASDGAKHWHEEHPWGEARERTWQDKMLPHFRSLHEALDRTGVKVINANPNSALTCWPRLELAEVLDRIDK